MALELHRTTVNGVTFLDFVRGTLIPKLHSFDGYSPMYIIVMDNCLIHRTQEVRDVVSAVGILLFYQPPYCSDYSPVELAFSYVKHYLKDHEDIIHAVSSHTLIKAAFGSITPDTCNKWIQHCGY